MSSVQILKTKENHTDLLYGSYTAHIQPDSLYESVEASAKNRVKAVDFALTHRAQNILQVLAKHYQSCDSHPYISLVCFLLFPTLKERVLSKDFFEVNVLKKLLHKKCHRKIAFQSNCVAMTQKFKTTK